MSSDIIYQQEVIKLPYPCKGEDVYAWLMLAGSSNTYGGPNGRKRARHWELHALGTSAEIMRRAIAMGCSVGSGGLWMGSRSNIPTPHGFIAAIRRRIASARTAELTVTVSQGSSADVSVAVDPTNPKQWYPIGFGTKDPLILPDGLSHERARLHAYDEFLSRVRLYLSGQMPPVPGKDYWQLRPQRAFGPDEV